MIPVGLNEDPALSGDVFGALHIGELFRRAGEFDLIHNNFDWKPLTYALGSKAPPAAHDRSWLFVAADSGGVLRKRVAQLLLLDFEQRSRPGTGLSGDDVQRRRSQSSLLSKRKPGDYLVFLGRFHPEKGTHLAIEIAKRAGVRLKMAAIPQDEAYFREQVQPHIDGDRVQFLGAVEREQRNELLSHALALVHMTTRPERFGMTMIEAMACGTPVLGARMGSIPEIVVDGVTGFCATTSTTRSRRCRYWRRSTATRAAGTSKPNSPSSG